MNTIKEYFDGYNDNRNIEIERLAFYAGAASTITILGKILGDDEITKQYLINKEEFKIILDELEEFDKELQDTLTKESPKN